MVSNTFLNFADGLKVMVPDSLDLITPYVLREQLDWFEDEVKFVRAYLQPGQHAIDIGANYGVFALSMARSVGPEGRLWAFEPASATASLLAQSIAANDFRHVQLEQCAVSRQNGVAHLSLSSHSELNAIVAGPAAHGGTEEVALVTLDDCMSKFEWRDIAFIKIDAEGEEANILLGGANFFEQMSPLVQYEVKAGTEIHLELVTAFANIGYESYRLVPGLNLLVPFDVQEVPDGFMLNLFCCKPDRAAQLSHAGFLVTRASLAQVREGATALLSLAAADPGCRWQQALGGLPYGQVLASRWAEMSTTPQTEQVVEALALHALSGRQDLSPAQRYCALAVSLDRLRQLCAQPLVFLRLASLARVAAEFGARTEAVAALQHLSNSILRTQQIDPAELFLMPDRRFDSLPPGDSIGNWVLAAALEAFEKLSAFSSFYTGPSARQRLEIIRDLGFGSPEMQRRLDLLSLRYGLR